MSLSKAKDKSFRRVFLFSAYILVVWSLYRFIFKLPDTVEEFLIKPILWLVPLFVLVSKEKHGLKILGLIPKKFVHGIYLVLALGVGFALEGLLLNLLKYRGLSFTANVGSYSFALSLLVSLATAFTEEITFRGYIFGTLWKISGNEWISNLFSSLIWGLVHLPIAFGFWGLGFWGSLGYVILAIVFGFGSSFIFAKTKNIYASVLLHIFWSWPIMLFR